MIKYKVEEWDTGVSGAAPVQVVHMAAPDEKAPGGFPVPVVVERAGQITGKLVQELCSKGANGRDGIIHAAAHLEEQLGYSATRADCIRAVKTIQSQLAVNRSVSDVKAYIPMRFAVWMSEQDFERVRELPGVESTDPKYAIEKAPLIESSIDWPENYTGDVLDPSGDRDGNGGEQNIDTPPPEKLGVLTQIKSSPVTGPNVIRPGTVSGSMFEQHKRGVSRG